MTLSTGFLEHKRALGRKYISEEAELRLLVALRLRARRRAARPAHASRCWMSSSLHGARSQRAQLQPSARCRRLPARLGGRARAAGLLAACRPAGGGRPPHGSRSCSTPCQARRLLDAAGALPDRSRAPHRGTTYRTIFALCYGLGLRGGEACALRVGDIDRRPRAAGRQGRQVRQEPPGPARPADRRADRRAARASHRATGGLTTKRRCSPSTGTRASPGRPPAARSPSWRARSGSRHRTESTAPRLHSLRHSFAVGCLLRWYRQGLDPAARLHQLSTFMGHVDPVSTAVYLTITPALLRGGQPPVRGVRRAGLDGGAPMTGTAARADPALLLSRPPDRRQGPTLRDRFAATATP